MKIRYHGDRPSACAPTPIGKMGCPSVVVRAIGREALRSFVPPTRETPRNVDATLPAIEDAARKLADDLRTLGLGVQADRALAIANATRTAIDELDHGSIDALHRVLRG